MRPRLSLAAAVVACVACVALVAGCSGGGGKDPAPVAQSTPARTPSASTPSSTIPPVDRRVVREGVATVQRYLDTWADRGIVAAGRYVVPAERVTTSSGQDISSGGVTRHELVAWSGPDDFTLDVWMSLTAEDLDDPFQARLALAANQHPHRIAVTRARDGRYLISFSTT